MKFFQRFTVVSLFLLTITIQAPSAMAGDDGTLAVITATALIIGQTANGEAGDEERGLSFVTSLGFQDKNLSFDQQYSGSNQGNPVSNDAEFSVHLPTANLSFTTAYRKFYVALKFEKSIVDTSTTTDETDRSKLNPSNANLIAFPGSEVDVSREDKSLTFGYNIWRRMNLFTGYMEGETTLKPNPWCENPFGSTCTRANYAYLQYFLGQPAYQQKYTEEGPYIGLSYAWSIASAGTLSASFAYAKMNGKYTDNANDPTGFFGGSFQAFDYRGDSTGVSQGVTWTAPLGESSSYFIDLRRQDYFMDAADKAGGPNAGTFVKTHEAMKGLTAGIQYYF